MKCSNHSCSHVRVLYDVNQHYALVLPVLRGLNSINNEKQ